jgi:DNA-binding transcriptional MerR regulator
MIMTGSLSDLIQENWELPQNPLYKAEAYNPRLTLSQIKKFLNMRGVNITLSMIQYYVKLSIIPPPVENLWYTRKHIILLALIDWLKPVYTLEEIAHIFKLLPDLPPQDYWSFLNGEFDEPLKTFGNESLSLLWLMVYSAAFRRTVGKILAQESSV